MSEWLILIIQMEFPRQCHIGWHDEHAAGLINNDDSLVGEEESSQLQDGKADRKRVRSSRSHYCQEKNSVQQHFDPEHPMRINRSSRSNTHTSMSSCFFGFDHQLSGHARPSSMSSNQELDWFVCSGDDASNGVREKQTICSSTKKSFCWHERGMNDLRNEINGRHRHRLEIWAGLLLGAFPSSVTFRCINQASTRSPTVKWGRGKHRLNLLHKD